jgi:6-pyruvoyltetrahydropterin/6-carboxytetrahydropterin synthase
VADIMAVLDHKFLNELEIFPDGNPSSESIARYVADTLQGKIDDPAITVARVTAWESDNASATYIPES